MTSTNVFQGMNQKKNSSRVLRPPGGGHTDVLGLGPDSCGQQQGRKANQRNFSSITEGTNTLSPVEPNPVAVPQVVPQVVTPVEAPQPPAAIEKPFVPPAKIESAPIPTQAAPQRVRVPPGGFSSGLW